MSGIGSPFIQQSPASQPTSGFHGSWIRVAGVRLDQHVGLGGIAVEPGSEGGEAGAVLLHARDCLGWHELGPEHAEQVHEADQEIANLLLFRGLSQVHGHRSILPRLGFSRAGCYQGSSLPSYWKKRPVWPPP